MYNICMYTWARGEWKSLRCRSAPQDIHVTLHLGRKTTVIAPLLALMLADGTSLVTQMVPSALLEMSIGVMREACPTPPSPLP